MASFSKQNPAFEGDTEDSTSEIKMDEADMLKRVQVANEGMKLLLNSKLREAEELFKKSR